MGISVAQLTVQGGTRLSSEKAFLEPQPQNLTIWTKSQVSKLLFKDKVTVGIETVDGTKGLFIPIPNLTRS